MFGRGQRPQPDAIEVILGPRATFAGSMRSETSIRIDGAVEGGLIETPANVILTEAARVTCEIAAKTVSIRGQFHGTIRADRVELLAGSRVSGVIHVNSFYMDEGVFMQAEVNLRNAPRPALAGGPARALPVLGPAAGAPASPPAAPPGAPPGMRPQHPAQNPLQNPLQNPVQNPAQSAPHAPAQPPPLAPFPPPRTQG